MYRHHKRERQRESTVTYNTVQRNHRTFHAPKSGGLEGHHSSLRLQVMNTPSPTQSRFRQSNPSPPCLLLLLPLLSLPDGSLVASSRGGQDALMSWRKSWRSWPSLLQPFARFGVQCARGRGQNCVTMLYTTNLKVSSSQGLCHALGWHCADRYAAKSGKVPRQTRMTVSEAAGFELAAKSPSYDVLCTYMRPGA